MKTSPLLRSLVLSLTLLTSVPSFAAVKKEFNVCWTIYAGWMPWGTISNEKIIDKWASKYGIKINIVQLNDYIESINQYTAGQFDGCTMTNMDALTIPAAGGVDSTALITGSYSDGNDGVVLKGADKKLSDLKGMSVYLPELSVSHYLLVRGLEKAGLQEKDVKVVNTSDADIVSAFGTSGVRAAVAWNPQLSVIKKTPQTSEVFSSSPDLAKTMQRVAQFSFDKGLLGEGAQSADFIGMTFPGNVTLGDAANRKLRFDDSYLKLAAAGQL